jgi:hypothetical protein
MALRSASRWQTGALGSREGQGGVYGHRGLATFKLIFFIKPLFYGGTIPHSLALPHARLHDWYFHVFSTLMGPIGRKIGNLGH